MMARLLLVSLQSLEISITGGHVRISRVGLEPREGMVRDLQFGAVDKELLRIPIEEADFLQRRLLGVRYDAFHLSLTRFHELYSRNYIHEIIFTKLYSRKI